MKPVRAAATFTSKKFKCPKHGEIIETLYVAMNTPQKGHYCLVCYGEWIAAKFPKVEPVRPDTETTPGAAASRTDE